MATKASLSVWVGGQVTICPFSEASVDSVGWIVVVVGGAGEGDGEKWADVRMA